MRVKLQLQKERNYMLIGRVESHYSAQKNPTAEMLNQL